MSDIEIVIREEFFSPERKNSVELNRAVSFIGSPSKHPYEQDKFILIKDPISEHTEFIEFIKEDVLFVEDLPSLLTNDNESVSMKKVWIKEGSTGLRMEPFIVAKTKSRTFMSIRK